MKKNNQEITGKRIATATYGCKINQFETACILNKFIAAGWVQVGFSQPADVYLINSCTVTNRTDYKSRNAIRKALKHKKENPAAIIIVTGCYSQLNHEQVKKLGAVNYIIDNNHKNDIFEVVLGNEEPEFTDIAQAKEFCELSGDEMPNRSRAFMKVQDGCNYFCAYCAVAYARGPSRSRVPENIITQVKQLTANGYKEIVLGGINLGLYGREKKDNYHLPELLADLEKISGLKQIRLSSIEPQLFDAPLMKFLQSSSKICPHFHIPLQSGSDEILKKVGRKYSTERFKETVDGLRNLFPDAAFGFDVICGLPGETEELFKQTKSFLESIPFAYLHVFPYSRRPGTRAYHMKDQVHGTISHQRVKELTALSQQKHDAYCQRIIDEQIAVQTVIEKHDGNYLTGLSDHYVRIYLSGNMERVGDVVNCRAIGLYNDGVLVKEIT